MPTLEEESKIVVVSNTGPLLSAFQCGRVDLLKRYFAVIYIAPSQIVELETHGAGKVIRELIAEGFVTVVTPLSNEEKVRAEDIACRIAALPSSKDPDYRNHLSEAEAMVVMGPEELDCVRILLDEKAARTVAEEIRLRITGFPGVVGRAGLDGLLTEDDIRCLLTLCRQRGTHYSDELIDHVAEIYGR